MLRYIFILILLTSPAYAGNLVISNNGNDAPVAAVKADEENGIEAREAQKQDPVLKFTDSEKNEKIIKPGQSVGISYDNCPCTIEVVQ